MVDTDVFKFYEKDISNLKPIDIVENISKKYDFFPKPDAKIAAWRLKKK